MLRRGESTKFIKANKTQTISVEMSRCERSGVLHLNTAAFASLRFEVTLKFIIFVIHIAFLTTFILSLLVAGHELEIILTVVSVLTLAGLVVCLTVYRYK
jgi:hypothetical protein